MSTDPPMGMQAAESEMTLEQAASEMLRWRRLEWRHALPLEDRVWVSMQPAPVWPWRVTQAVRWACRHG